MVRSFQAIQKFRAIGYPIFDELLNHGCPFPPEQQQLENLAKQRRGIQTFIISEFYLNGLSIDLWKSLEENKIKGKSRTIARRLLERPMYAERWGYADIDMFL